ncbi:MAG: VOC family protein [Actinomycetota bacterium]|nr:VOC family protein [Actinomycetota bacterium]
MPQVSSYPHGTFCWVELSTTDPEAAKRFYSDLFGWVAEDVPVPGGTYTMCRLDGYDVGAIQHIQEQMRAQGHPPFWLSYVSVDDVDAAAARASELGGNVMAPPFDVMDVGRMAVIQDPQRAALALWKAREQPGAGLVNEPGAPCWNELTTNDVATARDFYTSLFGWRADTQDMGGMEYTVFNAGERPAAGMAPLDPEKGGMSPSWSISFAVEDCDKSAAQIEELGGGIIVPPTDFPGGRFAVASDPQGAYFGVVRLDAPV